jgi:hypothetical protein
LRVVQLSSYYQARGDRAGAGLFNLWYLLCRFIQPEGWLMP